MPCPKMHSGINLPWHSAATSSHTGRQGHTSARVMVLYRSRWIDGGAMSMAAKYSLLSSSFFFKLCSLAKLLNTCILSAGSSQPLCICPLKSLQNLHLSLHPIPDVQQIIDVLQELSMYLTRYHSGSPLPQNMNFTEKKSMVLIRKYPVLCWS